MDILVSRLRDIPAACAFIAEAGGDSSLWSDLLAATLRSLPGNRETLG